MKNVFVWLVGWLVGRQKQNYAVPPRLLFGIEPNIYEQFVQSVADEVLATCPAEWVSKHG